MAAKRMNIRMEGGGRAHGRVGRKGAGDKCRLAGAVGAEEPGKGESRRDLGAVDQGEALFGGKRDGRKPRSPQRRCTRHAFAGIEGLAVAHHHRGHVRKRREVSGRANGAFLRDERDHALVQHRFEEPDEFEPHTGGAAAERDQLQCHDQPHDVFRERLADAAAMGEDQIALQRFHVGAVDLDRSQFAETCIDAVDGRIARDDLGNPRCSLGHTSIEGRVEARRRASPVYRFQIAERNRAGPENDGHRETLSPLKTRSHRGLKPTR